MEDLNEAIRLIKAGDKPAGAKILKALIQADRNNERAWLWMSVCVDKPDEKLYCLNETLRINPNNEAAQKQLKKIKPAGSILDDLKVAPTSATAPAPVPESIPASLAPVAITETKVCPYCQMQIPAKAELCPYCRKQVSSMMVTGDRMKQAGCAIAQLPFLILGIILSLAALWCIISTAFNW